MISHGSNPDGDSYTFGGHVPAVRLGPGGDYTRDWPAIDPEKEKEAERVARGNRLVGDGQQEKCCCDDPGNAKVSFQAVGVCGERIRSLTRDDDGPQRGTPGAGAGWVVGLIVFLLSPFIVALVCVVAVINVFGMLIDLWGWLCEKCSQPPSPDSGSWSSGGGGEAR